MFASVFVLRQVRQPLLSISDPISDHASHGTDMLSKKKKVKNVTEGVVGKYIKKEAPSEIPGMSRILHPHHQQLTTLSCHLLFSFQL